MMPKNKKLERDHQALQMQVNRLADALCDALAPLRDEQIAVELHVSPERAKEIMTIRMQYREGWLSRRGRIVRGLGPHDKDFLSRRGSESMGQAR